MWRGGGGQGTLAHSLEGLEKRGAGANQTLKLLCLSMLRSVSVGGCGVVAGSGLVDVARNAKHHLLTKGPE